MELPFKAHKIVGDRSWLERFIHRARPDLAVLAVQNELATKRPSELAHEVIAEIAKNYDLSGRDIRDVAQQVYRRVLTVFVEDESISGDELDYLKELRAFLTLTNSEIVDAESEVVYPRYEKVLNEVLRDGHTSSAESDRLNALQVALRLDQDTATMLRQPKVAEILNRKLESILSDRRVSPSEEAELQAIAANLGMPFTLSATEKVDKELFALCWQIENGVMPWYEVPINLQKSERCHFSSRADWYELRTKTVRANYSGVTYRVKIAKGLYYRVGSVKVAPVKTEELTLVDSGTIYVTNKRIIFDGAKANKTIRLSALLSIEPYADGIGLEKDSGKSPVIQIAGNVELATVVLTTLLAKND